MQDGSGGFYASLDADSEGEEGIFYTWTIDELREALGGRADFAIETFGVTIDGNFEGRNVLHLPLEQPPGKIDGELESIRSDLLAARGKRVRPALDDKVVLSWNALAISALAEAGSVLDRPDYLEAAEACSDFIWEEMRDTQGSLRRSWRRGEARLNAYLEDHAFLLEALLTLYQANFSEAVFKRAQGLAETMIDRFSDPDRGGFFTTSHDHEELIARRKDVGDHPIPSGSASAALGLLRLGHLTGENQYVRQSLGVLKLLAPATARQPDAFGHLLQALQLYLAPSGELAISMPGKSRDETEALLRVFRSRYRPSFVVALGPEGSSTPPLLASRITVDGKPAAYICENFTCQSPVTDPGALRKELDANDS